MSKVPGNATHYGRTDDGQIIYYSTIGGDWCFWCDSEFVSCSHGRPALKVKPIGELSNAN